MQNFMKTIIHAIQSWVKNEIKDSTADWNQNNSSANNYVKNRPFWAEEIILVDSLTSAQYENGNFPRCNFIEGESYQVIFNGKMYDNLICYVDDEFCAIASEDNGCPFYIDDDGGDALYVEADGDWTISIYRNVVHKLDSKYLDIPDNLASVEYVDTVIADNGKGIVSVDQATHLGGVSTNGATPDYMSVAFNYGDGTSTNIEYVTKDNLSGYAQPKGNYLTAIPDEYVTEDELSAKGYLTSYTETDPTVPDWAKAETKPTYTASEVGAEAVGAVATHNTDNTAHADIREQIDTLYSEKADITYVDEKVALTFANAEKLEMSYASTIEECVDTTKVYVLPDGYIYAHMSAESLTPAYTNILTGTELHLNQRINSSGSYVALNGYVSTDYLPMNKGDVVRVNLPLSNLSNDHDKGRGIGYNNAQTIAYGNDGYIGYYTPITEENDGDVCSIIFGQVYNTYGDSSSGTKMLTTIEDNTNGYMRFNFWISDSAITESDVVDLIITLNQPIVENSYTGYGWHNTGIPFVSADYDDTIQELDARVSDLESLIGNNSLSSSTVFAPSPQMPANGTDTADFDAENMTVQDIYDYIDVLCEQYPNYITKETLGKDESGTYDVNRYVLSKHYYKAWQQTDYPKMYGWVNDSTVIYSKSISPRIDDIMYSTAYVGTAYANVTAVDNANQARTVNGLVFTRDSSKDVEPTLVYTSIISDEVGNTVYKQNKSTATTISTITDTTLTGANGVSYTRYPMGDRNKDMKHLTVVTIGANEHGFTPDPREPAIVCSRLMKDLCECKNADNEFLNYLKNNIMLVVVPVINPYGFNLGSAAGYYNVNGVNINRNYDCPGWGNLDDTGTGAQGTYGGSEVETQYFMNTISEPKSAVAVSVHALGYSANGGSVLCHYQGNNFNATKIKNIVEVMAANYNMKFTDYGTTPPDTNQGGKSPAYITWAGAVGGLIEMQAEGASAGRNTAYILEADYTLLLQCVYMWLTDYEEAMN